MNLTLHPNKMRAETFQDLLSIKRLFIDLKTHVMELSNDSN